MFSLLIRNLFFTILKPGVVVGLIPYLIVNHSGKKLSIDLHLLQWVGIVVFILGLFTLLSCILRFAFEGKGTLSPLDPTRHLVVGGLYRYTRNPMYIGVMIILLGESIVFQIQPLWIYMVVVFMLFNLLLFWLKNQG